MKFRKQRPKGGPNCTLMPPRRAIRVEELGPCHGDLELDFVGARPRQGLRRRIEGAADARLGRFPSRSPEGASIPVYAIGGLRPAKIWTRRGARARTALAMISGAWE